MIIGGGVAATPIRGAAIRLRVLLVARYAEVVLSVESTHKGFTLRWLSSDADGDFWYMEGGATTCESYVCKSSHSGVYFTLFRVEKRNQACGIRSVFLMLLGGECPERI